MLHEVILSRSEELNIRLVSIRNCSSLDRIARCLSVQNNVNTPLESITSSQTRSICIFEVDEVPNSFLTTCFVNFKLMKTMDFEGAPINYIPKEVGNLFHLRYLSLRRTKVDMIPKSIGKLKNLETLDLKRSLVCELPEEINGLCKLQYLAAYIINYDIEFNIDFRQAVKVPSGIGSLESLQKLFNVEATNTAFIEELGKLRLLRKLEITKLKRESGITLCTSLKKMSHLRSLRICATSEEEVLDMQSMSSPPHLLQCLILVGRLEKLPKWISKLESIVTIALYWSRLTDDPLKVLQALPNLMNLRLHDGDEGKQLQFEGGGFQKLKYLALQKLKGLNKLIIDKSALPLLEELRIGPCPQLKEVPSGIHNLKCLKSLESYEMQEFMLSMQPYKGLDFWKVEHVSTIRFWFRIHGEKYKTYKIGDPDWIFCKGNCYGAT